MKIIILAGGGGSRLYPLSRQKIPKQFLKINSNTSLLAQTILRYLAFVAPEDIVIVTNQEYLYQVKNELIFCKATNAHVIVEPVARNTAPAIALAVKFCIEKLSCSEEEVYFVAPADHVIDHNKDFENTIKKAMVSAKKNTIIIFGIKPNKAETGYGYIEVGECREDGYLVKAFKEKPTVAVAQYYLTTNNHFWNLGMLAFRSQVLINQFSKYQPEILKLLTGTYEKVYKNFNQMPNISIDCAIFEHSQEIFMIPFPCIWNDIGSWDVIYDILPKDNFGNALQGDCVVIDCHNSLFIGKEHLIAGVGVKDLIVIATNDVILVVPRGESQEVKKIVALLAEKNRIEVL